MFRCANNHNSQTGDFCSICGAELTPAPAAAVPTAAVPVAVPEQCPDCGAVREFRSQAFCEACGHNFRTGAAGIVPPPPPLVAGPVRWEVTVRADANLNGTPNPDAPVATPPRVFTLFDEQTLVGRPTAGVRTQVPVADDAGVSRRQAMLIRRADGTLALRDLGSANGTRVNDRDVTPGVDAELADGDRIAIGAWTLITVRAVRS
jgi:hypothetical protein